MAKRDIVLFLCVLPFLLAFPAAYGTSIGVTWTGSGGDSAWGTASNWNPSGVPNNGSNTFGVTIGPSGAIVDLLGSIAIDSLAMNSSTLNMATGGSGSLTLATGPSSLTNSQIVGGTFTSNGTLTLNTATLSTTLNNNGNITTGTGLNILGGTLNNNAGATINVTNSAALQLEAGGTYTNNGAINVASSSVLLLDGSSANGASGTTVTLGGTGSLTLVGSPIVAMASGLTLVNGVGQTIQGSGEVEGPGLTLNNQGTINANRTTKLTLLAESIVNGGTMEATAAGGLEIGTNSVNNVGGTIVANGSQVLLPGPLGASQEVITGGAVNVINGGTLTAAAPTSMQGVTLTVDGTSTALLSGTVAASSTVNSSGTVMLSGAIFNSSTVNNSGTVTTASGLSILGGTLNNYTGASINVTNSAALQLEAGGSYTNNGTINIGSSSALLLDATPANGASGTTVALGGSGTLTLNDSVIVEQQPGGLTLVNGSGHTIQGSGGIGDQTLALTNQGTINANQAASLTVVAQTIGNSGTMEATAAGGLGIVANSVNNAGGTIVANGSTVALGGSVGALSEVITGGAVNVINNGILSAPAATDLEGVTLTVDNTSTAMLGGTLGGGSTVNNSGTVMLGAATFNSSTLNNYRTVTTAGGVNILGGTLNNYAGASIDVTNSSALQLEAGGSYTNNGTISIGSSSGLLLDGSPANGASGTIVTLGGSGTLTLNDSFIREPQPSGLTLVNGSGHTIQGSGGIGDQSLILTNQGTLNANQAASLTVVAETIGNSGTMEATAAGGLGIVANSVNNAGGTIVANGSTVMLMGAVGAPSEVITGGAVNVINTGILSAPAATDLEGVTLTVDKTSTAMLGGTVGGGGTVNNSGTVMLGAATFNSSTLNNYGTVTATSGLSMLGGTLTNEAGATINVNNSSGLEIVAGGTFTNNGTVNVAASSGFIVKSGADFTNFQNQTLSGGTYNIAGMFQLDGDLVTNQAALALIDGGMVMDSSGANSLSGFNANGAQGQFSLVDASFQSGGDFTNSGAVTIGPNSGFAAGPTHTNNYIQTGGSTIVDGELVAGTVDLNGGELSGTGTLAGNLENDASLDPGDAPGTLTIDGNYTQGADGVLNIEIDSASVFDVLAIMGNAQLDGTLNMTFGGGFGPQDLEKFTIMTFESSSGDFAAVNSAGNWLEIRTGDSITMEFVTPEPSTWFLLAAGLMGLVWFKRRASARG